MAVARRHRHVLDSVHRGGRHDLGNPGGFARAFVDYALQDPEYGDDLRTWLEDRLKG